MMKRKNVVVLPSLLLLLLLSSFFSPFVGFVRVGAVSPSVITTGNCSLVNAGSLGASCTATSSQTPSLGQLVGWWSMVEGSTNCASDSVTGITGSIVSIKGLCLATASGSTFSVTITIGFGQNGGVILFLLNGVTLSDSRFYLQETTPSSGVPNSALPNKYLADGLSGSLFFNFQVSFPPAGQGGDTGTALNGYSQLANFAVSETSGSGVPFSAYFGYLAPSSLSTTTAVTPSQDNEDGCTAGCGSSGVLVVFDYSLSCSTLPPQLSVNSSGGGSSVSSFKVSVSAYDFCQGDIIVVNVHFCCINTIILNVSDTLSPSTLYSQLVEAQQPTYSETAEIWAGTVQAATCLSSSSQCNFNVTVRGTAYTQLAGEVVLIHGFTLQNASSFSGTSDTYGTTCGCRVSPFSLPSGYFVDSAATTDNSGTGTWSFLPSYSSIINPVDFSMATQYNIAASNFPSSIQSMNFSNSAGKTWSEGAVLLAPLPQMTTVTSTIVGWVVPNLAVSTSWFFGAVIVAVPSVLAFEFGKRRVFNVLLALTIGSLLASFLGFFPLVFAFLFALLFAVYVWTANRRGG
jgi:hypothetical protein